MKIFHLPHVLVGNILQLHSDSKHNQLLLFSSLEILLQMQKFTLQKPILQPKTSQSTPCLERNVIFKLSGSKLLCLLTFLLLLTCACFFYLEDLCCCTAPSTLSHSACLSVLSVVTTSITPLRVYVLLSYLKDKENYNRVEKGWTDARSHLAVHVEFG